MVRADNKEELTSNSESRGAHIFLSYSRADAAVMKRVRKELDKYDITVWTDEGLTPGTESWKTTIEEAIRSATGMVVILSPRSYKSKWVKRELGYAIAQGVKIYPILASGDESNAIPIELINSQWTDIREKSNAADQVEKLVNAIKGGTDIEVESSLKLPFKLRAQKFIRKYGWIIATISVIITVLAVTYQFGDYPTISAIFVSPTNANTLIETPTETLEPPTTTNSPSPSSTDIPTLTLVFSATPTTTGTITQTLTSTLTPSLTMTPAVTLPAIVEADCVPKGTLRQKAYVVEAIDGATLKVRIAGDIFLVQYLGISVPEKEDYFGIYAHYKSVELVVDQWVTLVSGKNGQDANEYLQRYVFVGNTFVNHELIRQGFAYAEHGTSAGTCSDIFEYAQNQAQLSPAGMWKPTNTPWPSPAPGEPPCTCWADTRNCDTFRTQSEAQACFEYCQGLGNGDVHNLDDGDNWACESLP